MAKKSKYSRTDVQGHTDAIEEQGKAARGGGFDGRSRHIFCNRVIMLLGVFCFVIMLYSINLIALQAAGNAYSIFDPEPVPVAAKTEIVTLQAPRGEIYDRSGNKLVSNLTTYNASLDYTALFALGGVEQRNRALLDLLDALSSVPEGENLPAFCEEFLHRGIVLQGTKHMGFKKAIVISSLLFGLLHFSIQKVFYAFVIGLVLGLVSVVAKNIWVGIIIHFVNNAFSVYLDYARANNLLFGNMLDGLSEWLMTTPFIWVFICCSLFVIALISLLILFIWLLYKQAMLGKVKRALDKAYNSSDINKNTNVLINKDSVFNDLLEQNTLLNLTYRKMDNPIDIVLPKEKSRYKTTFKDNIFMIGAVVLGAVITIFTYIWGLL